MGNVVSFVSGGLDAVERAEDLSLRRPYEPQWVTLYQTGFEQPDFGPGLLGGQAGWTATIIGSGSIEVTNAVAPVMSDAQWLHFVAPGTAGPPKFSQAKHPFPNVAGRKYRMLYSFHNAGSLEAFTRKMSASPGFASPPLAVGLRGDQSIEVSDSTGGPILSATWLFGVRQDLMITVEANRSAWTLTLNGVDVYTGVPFNTEPDFIFLGISKPAGGVAWEANADSVAVQVFI